MPYYGAHSRMARLALEKLHNDEALSQLDRSQVIYFQLVFIFVVSCNLS